MNANPKEGIVKNIGVVLDNQSQSRNGSDVLHQDLKFPELQFAYKKYCLHSQSELSFETKGDCSSCQKCRV